MKKLLIPILLSVTNSTYAHTGHITEEAIHSLFHIEHIIIIALVGIVAFIIHKKLTHKT